MKIYDAAGMIIGRMASLIAKDALLGEEVVVVNCEQAMISGKKVNTFNNQKAKRARKGYPLKSAKLIRLPDRMVRRTIRGMLPYKYTRGREAYKRVMCHEGVPEQFKGKEMITIKQFAVTKLPNLNYISIGEVCKHLK